MFLAGSSLAGLARAIIRTTADHATPASHRSRMLEVDIDSGRGGSPLVVDPARPAPPRAHRTLRYPFVWRKRAY